MSLAILDALDRSIASGKAETLRRAGVGDERLMAARRTGYAGRSR